MRAGSDGGVSSDPQGGYVLIEVVATLAVIVMLMALSFPRVSADTSPTRMAALITASVSLLREARTEAIARGAPVATTFDAGRRMLTAGTRSVTIPPDVSFHMVAGGNCPAESMRAAIVFRPDGTNCGGILRFGKHGYAARAHVNWVDGRIDVAEGG